MRSLRELLEEMSLLSEEHPDRAIAFSKDGELKTYSKEEAEAIRNKWLTTDLEGAK